jgi:hypothetical protein
MNTTLRSFLCAAWLGVGALAGCAGDRKPATTTPADEPAPVTADAQPAGEACAAGVAQEGAAECAVVAKGLCFADAAAACACAGCEESACTMLETSPPQASCPG